MKFSPRGGVALAEAVDAACDVEEDRLRTGPAAPHAAEQCGDAEKAEAEAAQDEECDPHILSEKGEAEVVKLAMREIEEERGVAIDLNPRQRHVNRGERDGEDRAPACETPAHFRRMDEAPRAVFVDRGDGFERRARRRGGHVPGRARVSDGPKGRCICNQRASRAVLVPEGHWKLAGGEASPRAQPPEHVPQRALAPAGAAERSARNRRFDRPCRGGFDLFGNPVVPARGLASPPANLRCPFGTQESLRAFDSLIAFIPLVVIDAFMARARAAGRRLRRVASRRGQR